LLDATGLAPFPERAAGKLSGGMKQKLSLCCALVHNPDLLILDEPTTGVDPLSRRQFWALVDELQKESLGMTVIVATAYIEEAERFAHLLAMDDGKLLVNAPTQEVMRQYGVNTLEEAYIKMLPSEKQQGSGGLAITPFVPDPASPPAMEAHGLTKRFGDFTAVDNVSFRIEKGEIFGFLGSNGCGKSTTMKMLTGLLPATEGEAELLGKPIDAGGMAVRMRVGYMSQAFSLYEELSVRQNLLLHAQLYQMPDAAGKQAVADALAQFDLAEVADTRPADLSLGMRQRLQLAAACLHKPEVLILDEPTSGVDPAARDMFWRHLLKLSRQDKITIFISTHFMNEAARCDRISFMHRGRVLAVGTPAELTERQHAPDLEEAFVQYLLDDEQAEHAARSDGLNLSGKPENAGRPSETAAAEQSLPESGKALSDGLGAENRPSETAATFRTDDDKAKQTLPASEGLAAKAARIVRADQQADGRQALPSAAADAQDKLFSDGLHEENRPSEEVSVHQQYLSENEAALSDGLHEGNRPPEEIAVRQQNVSENEAALSDGLHEEGRPSEEVSVHQQHSSVNEAALSDGLREESRPSEEVSVHQQHLSENEAALSDGLREENRPSEKSAVKPSQFETNQAPAPHTDSLKYWFATVFTFAMREGKELLRDKIRLFFAVLGPVILMSALSWSISFDVQNLTFAVLDRDQSSESRALTEYFAGSRYFVEQPPLDSAADIDRVLKSAQTKLVIDIPPGFGRDLLRGNKPEVGFYVDGSAPFNAENIKAYVGGILSLYAQDQIRATGLPIALQPAAGVEARFMYNQDFKSMYAVAPGIMMLVLMLIPAMMTAIGVVREREIGSIANLYASPASVPQYLIGKQLPYIAVGSVNYLALLLMMLFWFQVPLKGSFMALSLGTLLIVCVSTALGLLVSSFVRSQVAAIFVTAIITLIPTINYSGFLYPISTMTGSAYWIGTIFPASWYLKISVGTFTKGLGMADLQQEFWVLAAAFCVLLLAACMLLKKQEK
jgi:ribosome-dependent ATPase